MYIHRLEGNWFRHPFWQSRFVLDDVARLTALHDSTVEWVLIDLDLGLDVAQTRPVQAVAPRPAAAPRNRGWAQAGRRAEELSDEIIRAERLTHHAGKAVSRLFLEARLGKRIAASDIVPVVDEVYASVQRNIYAFNGLLRCQSDQAHLYRHALAVCALMVALARRLRLPPDLTREAGMVGLLMDTALAQLSAESGVADYRDLPDDVARGHVLMAMTLLRAAGDVPPGVLSACMHHHERMDGSGYPRGLAGDAIDLLARMVAVCDDYDQLVLGSSEVSPLDPVEALGVIGSRSGVYDPVMVGALADALGVYPIGSLVTLRSGRLAMVVDQDTGDSALPVVRIFGMAGAKGLIRQRPVTLPLGQCFGEDAIVGVADPVALRLPPIDALRADLMIGAIRASIEKKADRFPGRS